MRKTCIGAASVLVMAALLIVLVGMQEKPYPKELPKLRAEAKLAFAPEVPPPVDRKEPAVVVVNFVTEEFEGVLMEGPRGNTAYKFWTFNGRVPGPFIRVRVGDVLELHIRNLPTSQMAHNVDFHAATGPGGGSAITTVNPGEERVVRLAMLHPGLFVYHCAVPPIPQHIANGMYGLILVEPEGGLAKVDREFYVMQSEFYTRETYGFAGLANYNETAGNLEHATYVVFNGRVGALAEKNAIRAKVGEAVRIFFGNAGPNLVSAFHVIGEVMDRVWSEGGSGEPQRNVQTARVAPGGAAVAEFSLQVPGRYTLVDHSIFRINKGVVGHLDVEGPENPAIYGEVKGPAKP